MLWNRSMWWKYLAVVLLVYVILGGISIPLGPGIVGLEQFELSEENNYKLTADVYNFSSEKSTTFRAFLKFEDNDFLQASSVKRLSKNKFQLAFPAVIPPPGSAKLVVASLLLEDGSRGTAVLPDALRYKFSDRGSRDRFLGAEEISFAAGSLHLPFRNILIETIRNLFYHVPMWFSMIILAGISFFYSWRFLRKGQESDDLKSSSLVYVALLLGLLGLITGSIWAKNTWGTFWTGDVKLNMSALVVLMYAAYALMRHSISDPDTMKRNVAAYNIFCFVAMIPLLFIVPRLQDSLHPGNGGNPGFGGEDLDGTMRLVFYPAVIGWTLLALWISNLLYRTRRLEDLREEEMLRAA